MGAEARMQPNALEQLRSALESRPWNHDSLAEYVSAVAQNEKEEEIFRRLVFETTNSGAYESLTPDEKAQLRQWWHERTRREAYRYEDLRARLSWRYMV
jgi:hypothetical protein